MKKRPILFLSLAVLFVFVLTNATAQISESGHELDSLKARIIVILKGKGEFSSYFDNKNLNNSLYIIELLSNEPIEFSDFGIYGVRVAMAPNQTYLLLRDKESFELLELREIVSSLRVAISFMEENKLSNENIVLYLKEILSLYQKNGYSKDKM
jgi:hypothetical protein